MRRLVLYLSASCLFIFLLFYVFSTEIVSSLFPNEVVVTTQGSFDSDTVTIKMIGEAGIDTVSIYEKGESIGSFRPKGLVQFLVYENDLLIANFEHLKEDVALGNRYHFYLSSNTDSVFMDMRIEGAGSGN